MMELMFHMPINGWSPARLRAKLKEVSIVSKDGNYRTVNLDKLLRNLQANTSNKT